MAWLRVFSVSLLITLLIVLIFFMAVLPMRPDVPAFIDVPTARWASQSPEFEHDLTISIRSDGRIYLGDAELGIDALEHRLSAASARQGVAPTLRVRADRAAMFYSIRRVVRAARNAGFNRVTFMVRQERMTEGMDFSFAFPAHKPNPWPAIGIAVGCLAGAVTIRFVRHSESAKPGCVGWLLLLVATLALLFVWSIYFPSCPPGMWC